MNNDRNRGQDETNQLLLRDGETPVGPKDMRGYTLARVYASSEKNVTPEKYLLLVNAELRSGADGSTYMRAYHAGDIHRNVIPLSMLDLDALIPVLVQAKADLDREQREYHARRVREERPSLRAGLVAIGAMPSGASVTMEAPEEKEEEVLDLGMLFKPWNLG
jgi:hypothetical protein